MRLAVLRHVPLREFAERLTDPAGILDELTSGDVSVRRWLAQGWRTLPPENGRELARLAENTEDGPFGLADAARALGCDERQAVRVVERLIDRGLVASPRGEATSHAAQYELPHLVRLYARDASNGSSRPSYGETLSLTADRRHRASRRSSGASAILRDGLAGPPWLPCSAGSAN
jgi:hypothetical protein